MLQVVTRSLGHVVAYDPLQDPESIKWTFFPKIKVGIYDMLC